jgi:hypothetical protein
VAVPLLAVAAAYGAARAGSALPRAALPGGRLARARGLAAAGALVALVAASLDLSGLRRAIDDGHVARNAIQLMADRRPDDVIVSYSGTLTTYYFGRTDFWLRPRGYAKYVWAGDPPYRDVHSGAPVIRNREEFDQLVVGPMAGRRVWVIIDPATSYGPEVRDIIDELMERGADTRRGDGDDRLVFLMRL